jgi:asparagine synthase (glutamine-hydrolysing)
MLGSLAARGEVREELADTVSGDLLAGTQRLRIVDRDRAVQPWVSADGQWVLCYNGEVFNHRELRRELVAAGRSLRSESDTEVVLEAFLAWGPEAVSRLRGEFAFAIVSRADGRVFLARDPLGVKPLYWSMKGGRLHVASEVKALVPVGARVVEVPPGHSGWATPATGAALRPYVDLWRLGADQLPIEDPDEAVKLVRAALTDSVRVRVDTDLTVGVVLSGGLASSLTRLLPSYVLERPKNPMSYSSGLHERARLHKPRFARAHRGFGYDLMEPVRRDFDSVLARCGNDLER